MLIWSFFFVRLPPFLFYEKKTFITFLWNRNYCKNLPFIIFWLQILFWCMCDVKSYVWSIKKFTLRWRYFFYLLRSSFKLRMTFTFFWYVNISRWRAHHCQLGTQWLHHRISIFNVYFLEVVRQHRRVRLTTLIVRLHRVRIIETYAPVRIRHFFAALRKHFCNPRSAPPFGPFRRLAPLVSISFQLIFRKF